MIVRAVALLVTLPLIFAAPLAAEAQPAGKSPGFSFSFS